MLKVLILTIKNDINEDEIEQELLQVLKEATDQLIEKRKKEGAKISVDILNKYPMLSRYYNHLQ